jgi:two-component system sensor histidine kinase/response regulator
MTNENKQLILAVDDQPNNLKVISSALGHDYKISLANSGAKALNILENLKPDLILLDVMMPDMDGFDTIRLMKDNPKWRDIPVIFLTAKSDDESIINGFELGAVDYITKPFNVNELRVRARNHILLRTILLENEANTRQLLSINNKMTKLNDELEKKNEDLFAAYQSIEEHAKKTNEMYEKLLESDEKIQIQNKQLSKINSEKDKFFSIISHDLRSPFSGLLGLAQLMLEKKHLLSEEDFDDLLNELYNSLTNIYKLVSNLLEWSRLQRGGIDIYPEKINLCQLIDSQIDVFDTASKNKKIKLINKIPENIFIFADENSINTVFRNLLSNALKFTKEDGNIKIYSETDDKVVRIIIEDNGIGMSPDTVEKLFSIEKKITTYGTSGETGTGLGLILSKEFIEKNKGTISVKSEEGKGSAFTVSFPVLS